MLPQISYTSSNFPNASAASPCSPLTSSSIFINFFNLLFRGELSSPGRMAPMTEVLDQSGDTLWPVGLDCATK